MLPSRSTTSAIARVRAARRHECSGEDDRQRERGERELARRSRREPNGAAGPTSCRRASTATTTAAASTTTASRKCDITATGSRSTRTVSSAERRLRERPERRDPSARARPARQLPRKCDATAVREREQDRKQADDAVSELDERVVVLLGEHGARRATRPALAPEPRARQPHRRAADDDHVERDRRRRREQPERRRRELEAAHAARLRLDLHRGRG